MLEINYMEMAKKIREKRKHINKSQEEFCRIIGIGRSTLSNIECDSNNSKGHTESEYEASFQNITFAQLVAMCNEFNCSLGHLIGEYTCRTYDNQFINSCTGLSDESIEIIRREKDYAESGKYNEFVYMINEIICNNSSFNTENSLFFNIMECCYLNYGIKKSQKLEMDNCDASKDDNLHKATVESRKLYDLKVFETMEIFKHTLGKNFQ